MPDIRDKPRVPLDYLNSLLGWPSETVALERRWGNPAKMLQPWSFNLSRLGCCSVSQTLNQVRGSSGMPPQAPGLLGSLLSGTHLWLMKETGWWKAPFYVTNHQCAPTITSRVSSICNTHTQLLSLVFGRRAFLVKQDYHHSFTLWISA